MSRRYVASLAIAAIMTLTIGIVVRRQLRSVEPSPAAPPSEASAFQQLSQEGQARRLSAFLNERATDVAALVEYVPASQASGLRWRTGDTLITTFSDRPVVALRVTRGDTTRTPLVAPSDSVRGEWIIVVARRRDGTFASTAGVVGGRMVTRCADRDVSEYVIGVPIPDGFAGAGLFDLSGRVMGMVARCGQRLLALPLREMTRLLSDPDSSSRALRTRFGVALRPLDDAARSYFGTDSGLLVTEVIQNGPADVAGWLPGDVIGQVDGSAIDSIVPRGLLESSLDSHTVVIRRGGTLRATRLSTARGAPQASDRDDIGVTLGSRSTPRGVEIVDVRPASWADSAGLRPGDRLIRVGSVGVAGVVPARRLLDRLRLANRATFIVYQRDSISRGVLLRR